MNRISAHFVKALHDYASFLKVNTVRIIVTVLALIGLVIVLGKVLSLEIRTGSAPAWMRAAICFSLVMASISSPQPASKRDEAGRARRRPG